MEQCSGAARANAGEVCLRLSFSLDLADITWMSSGSVQQLAQRMEQKSADTSQQMEALSQEMDGMHAEVTNIDELLDYSMTSTPAK